MPCKKSISSLLFWAIVFSIDRLASSFGDINYSSDEEESSTATALTINTTLNLNGFVNCEHVQRLFQTDRSQFDLALILNKCWHHGATVEDLIRGVTYVADRQDMENYEFEDLYLACDDVFRKNVNRLSSRLVHDYLNCKAAGVIDPIVQSALEKRFADIITVYTIGNQSITIDEETLVSCTNTSKQITMLCRRYGLAADQWSRGFLSYYYVDQFIIEEDLNELSLTCDRVFLARLQDDAYDDPIEAFVKCQASMSLEPEVRDTFEKKNAEKVRDYRAQAMNQSGVDLRAYVSCRHLRPLHLRNAVLAPSRYAIERCHSIGLRYEDLQAGVEDRINNRSSVDVEELYVNCESVFNDELGSFNTALLNDYERCKEVDRVKEQARNGIRKRFAKLFTLLAGKNKIVRSTNVTEVMVRCTGFTGKLAELCRRNGSTLAQELRGIGSISQNVGELWLNAEDLENLYLHCNDLFDDYVRHLRTVPVDQFMQCRWVENLSEASKNIIDKRIGRVYRNKHRWNGTRYRGDTDIEITSMVLANQDPES